jgi:ABC-type nickel/cobalt efflux system permease component RcnA
VLVVPAIAFAHPLGNFTINHYAGIRIEPSTIFLDVVVDQAEIPTFQARLDFDTDGDGEVSDAEADAGRVTACDELMPDLELKVADARQAIVLTHAGLTFPQGVGGLPTMRAVCEYRADLASPITDTTAVTFADTSFAERLGWREIVTQGSGVVLTSVFGEIRAATQSDRLTLYPTNLLTQALNDVAIAVTATPGGESLAPYVAADASAVPGAVIPIPSPSTPSATGEPAPMASPSDGTGAGTVSGVGGAPGGVTGSELPSIFRETDLTPFVLLLSLLTAGALGAGHALTPGHGKTLMAAYLVGSRGTVWHAAGLGLSVTVSHTIGILALAALVIGASDVIAPDVVMRGAPFVAAVSIVAIGGWMLFSELRRRRRLAADPTTSHEHDHQHEHEPTDAGTHSHDHADAAAHTHDHDEPAHDDAPAGTHSHGGISHSHLPAEGSTITWRSLFVLGLAGGLIPSTSALLILLGSIAAGRAGFGFVLVVAFGLGMALVMGGIGVALVLARGRVDRMAPSSPLGRVSGFIPLAAAVLVFGLGLYLTVQAVSGTPVL